MRWTIPSLLLSLVSATFPAYAQNGSQTAWKQFRETYPYHIQTTAISGPSAIGSRVLIVSEPPPHVTMQDFIALNPNYLSSATVQKQRVGYDGWVKDIVVQLPPLADSNLRNLLDSINYYLYGTTYKTNSLALPATHAPNRALPLDIRVTTADLNRWLIAGGLTFKGLGDARSSTVTQLLEQKHDGVYLSDEPGIAIWVLPRAGDYSRFRREARQFALDSDLIAGAIANSTDLAIVARERTVPLDTVPPLRSETILQLADVASDSLEQSYERTYILAGKYDGERDWAPIYLSDSLIDTEYGSLLNLTDQLLKSWSMAGLVKYVDFPYPAPQLPYPFPGGLASEPDIQKALDETDEGLTFNWNTNGAGYVDTVRNLRVYALNRTGALPISYLSGGTNSTEYEKTAYRWFAEKTYDPNLARVVQYAALYQIFHEFRIRPLLFKATTASKQPKDASLADAIAHALNAMRRQDCQALSSATNSQNGEATHRLMHLLGYDQLEHSCQLLNELAGQNGELGLRPLAAMLASGGRSESDLKLWVSVFSRGKNERMTYVDSLPPDKRRRLDAMMVLQDVSADPMFRRALAKRVSRASARDMYVAGAARPESGWIHTASIVVSWPTGAFAEYTGGHNLDAKVGRFVEDTSVATGDIRIVRENGERVIHYNPVDRIRLPEWLHDAAVAKDDAALLASVRKTFRIPPDVAPNRVLPVALRFDAGARAERGLTSDLAGQKEFGKLGWGETITPSPREASAVHAIQNKPARALLVERFADGYYRVLEGQTGRVYQARSLTDVMDTVVSAFKRSPGKPPTTLVLAGFDEGEAVSFRGTAESWMQREGLSERRAPTVRVADETVPLDRAVKPLRELGDLSRARFGEWELKDAILPSGKAGKVYETTVDVPPRVGGFKGFILKIRVYFQSLFPGREALRMVDVRTKASLDSLSEDADLSAAAAAVEKDLRSTLSDVYSVALELSGIATAQHQPQPESDAYSPAD